MLDNSAMLRRINRLREEHQAISEHLKLVGDSLSDREALRSLRGARSDWVPSRPQILGKNLEKLQQTLSHLEEGLGNHFVFEEDNLPPLCGDLLMKAILVDHQEIRKKLDEAKSIVFTTKLDGISEGELTSLRSRIIEAVDNVLNVVGEHARKEQVVLEMMRAVLEDQS